MKKTKASKEINDVKSLLRKFKHPEMIEWIRTGVHALDLAVGGGIPLGRIIEVFGNESAGKSLLGWTILKMFQQRDGACMVIDSEAKAPARWMKTLGVDTELLRYEKAKTVEQARKYMHDFIHKVRAIDKEIPICILLDSVACLTGENQWEKDKEMGESVPKDNNQPGVRAKAFSEFFAEYTVYLQEQNVTLVCINQIREKIGVMYGKKTESPGGRALHHHASVRIELSRGGKQKTGDAVTGQDCYLTVQKNQCASPFRKTLLRISWEKGYDAWAGLDEILVASGRVKMKRAGIMAVGEDEFPLADLHLAVGRHPELIEEWL